MNLVPDCLLHVVRRRIRPSFFACLAVDCPSHRSYASRAKVLLDGILYVNDYLSDCEGITDIYLPDSLLYINAASMNLKGIKLHCHEGTEIQKHLAAQGIEWVKIE